MQGRDGKPVQWGHLQKQSERSIKAAGYFRVSDEDNVEGYSLDAQRRAVRDFCRQKGWELPGTYSEEGRSAWVESIAKRPAFRRLLDDAQARKFDVVVTHTLDRFSRNLLVMLDAFHIFAQNDVTTSPSPRRSPILGPSRLLKKGLHVRNIRFRSLKPWSYWKKLCRSHGTFSPFGFADRPFWGRRA